MLVPLLDIVNIVQRNLTLEENFRSFSVKTYKKDRGFYLIKVNKEFLFRVWLFS
ncbi:MAG: hypothetical protein R3Y52_01915 [Psittacicella sp.]